MGGGEEIICLCTNQILVFVFPVLHIRYCGQIYMTDPLYACIDCVPKSMRAFVRGVLWLCGWLSLFCCSPGMGPGGPSILCLRPLRTNILASNNPITQDWVWPCPIEGLALCTAWGSTHCCDLAFDRSNRLLIKFHKLVQLPTPVYVVPYKCVYTLLPCQPVIEC